MIRKRFLMLVNGLLAYLGFRVDIKRTIRRSVLHSKYLPQNINSTIKRSSNHVLIYLVIGRDVAEFVINSIKSFRNHNEYSDIIVFTNKIDYFSISQKKELRFSVVSIDDDNTGVVEDSYYEFNTPQFNAINNKKWEIILNALDTKYE